MSDLIDPATGKPYRRIIHLDLDAFYASVEQRDHPELRGKAIAVGISQSRGVIATASYEARKFGIHSAMPSMIAKKLCPDLIFVQGRMDVYREISQTIHSIFLEYTDLVEPISIDEAFLDVTENFKGYELGCQCATEIKEKIFQATGLTASAGVSYNKFLAKIASDWRKPNGLCIIHPKKALQFIDQIPIKEFWGVGEATLEKMERLGIRTGAQLRKLPLDFLIKNFGKSGTAFYNFSRGIDHRPVTPTRERKQVSSERTFIEDIKNEQKLDDVLQDLSFEVHKRALKKGFKGMSLTVKLRFSDFTTLTRSQTQNKYYDSVEKILSEARTLIEKIDHRGRGIRLVGIAIGNAKADEKIQENLDLFSF